MRADASIGQHGVIALVARVPVALIVSVLLCISIAACGGSGKATSAASHNVPHPPINRTTASTRGSSPPVGLNRHGPGTSLHEAGPYITFGRPANQSVTREVRHFVERYYATVAAGDATKACEMIYPTLANALPEDYGTSPPGPPDLKGKTCAAVMTKLFEHRDGQPTTNLITIIVTSVRVKGVKAIALLHSPAMMIGEVAVRLYHHNAWKMWQLLGSALAPNSGHHRLT